MTHARVKSSNLHSVAHEGDTLEVRFVCPECKGSGKRAGADNCAKCGSTGYAASWVYSKVPPSVHRAILESESPGSAFASLVRGKFEGRRL